MCIFYLERIKKKPRFLYANRAVGNLGEMVAHQSMMWQMVCVEGMLVAKEIILLKLLHIYVHTGLMW